MLSRLRTAPAIAAVNHLRMLAAPSTVRAFSDHSVSTWSPSQVKRQDQMKGPRFVGVDISKQPLPKPAIDLLAKQPVTYVESRIVVCDGGHEGAGHPRVFINLDDTTQPNDCLYCGKKFAQKPHHHHH